MMCAWVCMGMYSASLASSCIAWSYFRALRKIQILLRMATKFQWLQVSKTLNKAINRGALQGEEKRCLELRFKVFLWMLVMISAMGIAPALAKMSAPMTETQPIMVQISALGNSYQLPEQSNDSGVFTIDDLSREQATQIETIFVTYNPQIQEALLAYQVVFEDLANILLPTTLASDLAEARAAVLAAGQNIDDLIFERTMAVREVLTLEQRREFTEFLRSGLGI
jgi:hypothetical protein